MIEPTATTTPQVCVDRFTGAGPLVLENGRLVGLRAKLWPPTQRVLRVRFLGGDAALHAKVARYAQEWTRHANIHFIFDSNAYAPIRIAFEPGTSWSYIGADALDPSLARDEPTMNFGWLTPNTSDDECSRVVLHEFGHALGLLHEHQSPVAEIPWNREAVYAFYAGPPNYWPRTEVDRNIFERYRHAQTSYSAFDPESIMLYPIPADLTDGIFNVGWNRTLSSSDRSFIRTLYP